MMVILVVAIKVILVVAFKVNLSISPLASARSASPLPPLARSPLDERGWSPLDERSPYPSIDVMQTLRTHDDDGNDGDECVCACSYSFYHFIVRGMCPNVSLWPTTASEQTWWQLGKSHLGSRILVTIITYIYSCIYSNALVYRSGAALLS